MTTRAFLAWFLGIPAVFVLLDGWELRRTRAPEDGGPSREAVLFLAVILAVYAALQIGGYALVPTADRLVVDIRAALARGLGRTVSTEPVHGIWLGSLTVVLFYVSGLWDYLLHRFFSHSRWFFFTHEYHHLPRQVNVVIPGIAARPFAVVATFPATVATVVSAYALLLAFGLPLWDLTALKLLLLVQAFLLTTTHSCFMRRWWWVHDGLTRLAITTPQEHLLHHTVDLEGNYGNFTLLWDRIFGTYLDPRAAHHQGHALGLAYDQDFLGTLTLGRLKLPGSIRRRFRVDRYCNLGPAGAATRGADAAARRAPSSAPVHPVEQPRREPRHVGDHQHAKTQNRQHRQ